MKRPAEAKKMITKEKIIEATIKLIEGSNGDITDISTRDIADAAGVGAGLLNYHFQTKENLVEICVDRIIKNIVTSFNPSTSDQTPVDRLKYSAKIVFDFFVANPAIVRVSMLSDIKNPRQDDNTVLSSKLIAKTLSELGITEKEHFLLSFTLVSVMQTLFLRRAQCGDLFGYDMNDKKQRDAVIDILVENIFSSNGHKR